MFSVLDIIHYILLKRNQHLHWWINLVHICCYVSFINNVENKFWLTTIQKYVILLPSISNLNIVPNDPLFAANELYQYHSSFNRLFGYLSNILFFAFMLLKRRVRDTLNEFHPWRTSITFIRIYVYVKLVNYKVRGGGGYDIYLINLF